MLYSHLSQPSCMTFGLALAKKQGLRLRLYLVAVVKTVNNSLIFSF